MRGNACTLESKTNKMPDEYIIPDKAGNDFWPLPYDYDMLTQQGQWDARHALLQSWWSYDEPERLITRPYNFCVAFRFFIDNYIKPSGCMNRPRKVFAKPDCLWADHWIRMLTHPLVAMVAFRGASKTIHFVQLYPQFVALCRPGSVIALSEYNDTRTREEIGEIQRHFEENDLYQEEFQGMIKPSRDGRRRWSSAQLDLLNGSQIRGVSINAAVRGRHPNLWVLDDIEKDKEADREDWRANFLHWFHGAAMGMIRPGAHVVWPGTYLNPVSCLMTAVKKLTTEFSNWKTIECPLIVREINCLACGFEKFVDIDEEVEDDCPSCNAKLIYAEESRSFGPGAKSMWPEVYTVEQAELMLDGIGTEDGLIKGMTAAAFWTEIMNRPHLGGDRMFDRSDINHGYRVNTSRETAKKSVTVIRTLETFEYDDWLESLHITAGVDIAYGLSAHSDYSSCVVTGFDTNGLCWVLDAWRGRVSQEERLDIMREIAKRWSIVLMGWECTAHSVDLAQRARYEMRDVTTVYPIKHGSNESKAMRISRLELAMTRKQILFPVTKTVDGVESDMHMSVRHINALVQEVDRYTRNGKGTAHDDLLDALEMAVWVNGDTRGEVPEQLTDNEKTIRELQEAGIAFTRNAIPMEIWTPEMHMEARGYKVPKERKSGRPKIW